jgi:PAS domain S-box-containing protein
MNGSARSEKTNTKPSMVAAVARGIPDDILSRWQDIVNIMAQILEVPTAIIAKIEEQVYEVYRVNSPNPHGIEAGKQYALADVYCETVAQTRQRLLIRNALKAERWKNHPEVRFGYISYLGYPIFLPSGDVFGTICVFDTKENGYSESFEKMIFLFKDQIEAHIHLLYHQITLEDLVTQRTDELGATNRKLLLEIKERRRAHRALTESEARFRNVLEHSLVGLSIVKDGELVYQNPEHERILGKISDSLLFPYVENIHPDDAEKVETVYRAFIAGETPRCEIEFRFHPFGSAKKASDVKWIHCRVVQIRDRKTPAVLVSIIDITRIKELEAAVRIEDRMSALGRVAAGITHELRNPLSAIKIYLQVLQEDFPEILSGDKDPDTLETIISKIREAAGRIEGIVKKVVDFAKPCVPQPALVNLNSCLEKALELAATAIRKAGIELRLILDANLPACRVDPLLIENALLNLINNAVDELGSFHGPRRLAISSAASKHSISIRLSDSGPGIPEDIRERIFDPFFTTKSDGVGIGLCMARRIIRDHGGTLDVSTSAWNGAEFLIHIPKGDSRETKENSKRSERR